MPLSDGSASVAAGRIQKRGEHRRVLSRTFIRRTRNAAVDLRETMRYYGKRFILRQRETEKMKLLVLEENSVFERHAPKELFSVCEVTVMSP